MPPQSALEIGRLDLLKQLGLRTRNAPPCWRDDNDPSVQQHNLSLIKASDQKGYAEKISKPRTKRDIVEPTGAAPSYLETLTLHQEKYPGPGQYYHDDINSNTSGGRFNKGYPKSDIEFIEISARAKPGPGQYESNVTNRGMPLRSQCNIKFGESDRLSELDILQSRARKTPGPGDNGPVDGPRAHIGTKFSLSVVPTELDIIERNSNKSPAPHDYGRPDRGQVAPVGGQFSTAFPPSSLEAIIRAKKNVPGPAQYNPAIPQNMYVGKCSMARFPGEEERRLNNASRIPGPGNYKIKTTLRKNPGITKWPQITRRPALSPYDDSPKKAPSPQRNEKKKTKQESRAHHSLEDSYGDEFET